MNDPSTESYVRPEDGARMVAIAPWQFVSAGLSQAALAAREAARKRQQQRRAAQ